MSSRDPHDPEAALLERGFSLGTITVNIYSAPLSSPIGELHGWLRERPAGSWDFITLTEGHLQHRVLPAASVELVTFSTLELTGTEPWDNPDPQPSPRAAVTDVDMRAYTAAHHRDPFPDEPAASAVVPAAHAVPWTPDQDSANPL